MNQLEKGHPVMGVPLFGCLADYRIVNDERLVSNM